MTLNKANRRAYFRQGGDMENKEGLSRVAKLMSFVGWIFLALGIFVGIGMAFGNGGVASFLGVVVGAFLFVVIQGLVWVLDGFIGNNGAHSNLLWPKKRSVVNKNSGSPEKPENTKPQLRGVQGWLLLLVVSLMFIGPLRTIGGVMDSIGTAEMNYPALINLPAWGNYKTACWIMVIATCAAMIWAGNGLRKHHIPASVSACICILWATPIASISTDYFAAAAFLDMSAGDYFGRESLTVLAQGIICAAVWTAYLKMSKRVKNTYHSD